MLCSAGALYAPAGTALVVALVCVPVPYAERRLGNHTPPRPAWLRLTPYLLSACGVVLFVIGMLGGFRAWEAGAKDTPLLLGSVPVLMVSGRLLAFKVADAAIRWPRAAGARPRHRAGRPVFLPERPTPT
ncbi:hypothetical protein [Streptomyces sp. R44]|uniref:Uncharacterized protein n=1 Tax=Streptomyces sp. R44 TaxID=3238633 RepID=A0AB39TAJ2_9ACTN